MAEHYAPYLGYLVMCHQSKEEELYKLQPANKMGKVGRLCIMQPVI